MNALAAALARRIWPEVETLPENQRNGLQREVLTILYGLPWLVLAIGWLIAATDLALMRRWWPFLLLVAMLNVLAGRISYFQIVGRRAGEYGYNSSDLENVITTSAVLIVGPPAIWSHMAGRLILFLSTWPREDVPALSANWARNLMT